MIELAHEAMALGPHCLAFIVFIVLVFTKSSTVYAANDLALTYKALPCADLPLIATKPVRPSSLRAFFTASDQAFKPVFTRPPLVFAFCPENTRAMAPLPRAMVLRLLDFIDFIATFMNAIVTACVCVVCQMVS